MEERDHDELFKNKRDRLSPACRRATRTKGGKCVTQRCIYARVVIQTIVANEY